MSNDPQRRYRSASEARGLAQVVLQERLAGEIAHPRERTHLLPWHRQHDEHGGPPPPYPGNERQRRSRAEREAQARAKAERLVERERPREAEAQAALERDATIGAEDEADAEAKREAEARAKAERAAELERRRDAERLAKQKRDAELKAKREAEARAKGEREDEKEAAAKRQRDAELAAKRRAEQKRERERQAAAAAARRAKREERPHARRERAAQRRNQRESEKRRRVAAGETKRLGAQPTKREAKAAAPRRAGMLRLLLLGGALAVGVAAGALIAGGDPPPAPEPFRVASADLGVQVPGDWRGSASATGGLSAHPDGDPGSGLTLERVNAPVESSEQASPVRLGAIEAWRDAGAPVDGARAAVTYVIPTATGKLVATCRASRQAAPGTLRECERSLSTLRLPAATNLPLADVVAQQEAWQAAVTALGEQRVQPRSNLARAERPAGQELAAQALARVHERAATRFAALPGGEDVAAAARRTAAAYNALARTAGTTSTQRWRAAVERVRRSEDALREAIAAA